MGTRGKTEQRPLFMATSEIVRSPGNAFYERLNQLLDKHRFDQRVEKLSARYSRVTTDGRAWRQGFTTGCC